jgi:hypothetical protein
MAVSSPKEDSVAAGVGGNEFDDAGPDYNSGAVYVFERDGFGTWVEDAYVKASSPALNDYFGWSVALSGDGATMVVGAPGKDVGQILDAGAAYVFAHDGQVWSQQAYVQASTIKPIIDFGWSAALSDDGDTMAIGACFESSDATGIDGDENDQSAPDAGAVYMFVRDGQNAWSQQAFVKASNSDDGDDFGRSVALSGDGNTLAVSASWEDSSADGVGANQADETVLDAGAAYVFVRDQGVWSQSSYVKAPNSDDVDYFSWDIALSSDGSILAVGAAEEDSAATDLGGDQANESADNSGAIYLY